MKLHFAHYWNRPPTRTLCDRPAYRARRGDLFKNVVVGTPEAIVALISIGQLAGLSSICVECARLARCAACGGTGIEDAYGDDIVNCKHCETKR